ncbi:hypothetical protein MtrunA17_Chr8g0393171 [Medicago truncatula]|uniref:Transmembrane protein n=1 Tax=Medicago truncatula TaxID=3880 RepID=A0A396GS31_MEDTR|nr:hypothetical protein MtrunA17_Chr8g0393171 [Medicago truncatula]
MEPERLSVAPSFQRIIIIADSLSLLQTHPAPMIWIGTPPLIIIRLRHDTKPKTPFGYSRKDVILIGLGVTFLGIALKSGLEFAGFDPLQAGNVVQLVLVLGLTVGWISTYIFRVSNKEMTYAQQLRDYESKVMEKRLESLTEAELQVLLQEVEEEKSR